MAMTEAAKLREMITDRLKVVKYELDMRQPLREHALSLELIRVGDSLIEALEALERAQRFSHNCKNESPVIEYIEDLASETISKVCGRFVRGHEEEESLKDAATESACAGEKSSRRNLQPQSRRSVFGHVFLRIEPQRRTCGRKEREDGEAMNQDQYQSDHTSEGCEWCDLKVSKEICDKAAAWSELMYCGPESTEYDFDEDQYKLYIEMALDGRESLRAEMKEVATLLKTSLETIEALMQKATDRGTQRFAYGEYTRIKSELDRLTGAEVGK